MCSSDKALIITPFYKPNIGGAETFAEDLAKAISNKYVVHVCTIKFNKQINFEGMDFKKSIYLIREMFFSLLKMKMKYKYKKVYALGLMSSFLCVIFGIKFDAIIFNLFDKKIWWITYILNKADKVFVEGKTGKKNLTSIGVKNIIKFNHWCDHAIFNWSERNNKNMKVLFVGRPIKIKGKHIINKCEKLTVGIDYEYVENCKFEDLPKYYKMADVVVIPSLYNDTFSRICVEAASCGCVLVVSNRGSLPEQVEGFGKCIDPTPLNFSKILNGLNKNRDDLEKLKLHTFIHSRKYFSEENANCFLY